MFRKFSTETETRIREAVRKFILAAPLEDSTVLLDGPGIGCTSYGIVIAYLGMERVRKLKAFHSFSSASFGIMYFLAREAGKLTLRPEEVIGWNRTNQWRHGTALPGQLLTRIPSLLRKRHLFPIERAVDSLTCSIAPDFVQTTVADLPKNIHFWTHNRTENRLEDIHAGNPSFAHWTLADVISASVCVPYIYQPFHKDGKVFRDPLFAPNVRALFKQLRTDRNVLFWNMKYSAEKETGIAVKAHESPDSLRRIILDEVIFLLGIDNREFDVPIQRSLFEIAPL